MADPFRARTKPLAPSTPDPSTSTTLGAAVADSNLRPSRAELEEMKRPELVALAKARSLDSSGTKAELVDRLAPP